MTPDLDRSEAWSHSVVLSQFVFNRNDIQCVMAACPGRRVLMGRARLCCSPAGDKSVGSGSIQQPVPPALPGFEVCRTSWARWFDDLLEWAQSRPTYRERTEPRWGTGLDFDPSPG